MTNKCYGDLNEAYRFFSDTAQRSFWTVEYYQKFFNVNTNDVLERLKRSMIPHGSDNYLITHIRPNPDLYGPFWICMTLVFSIAISENVVNYLQTTWATGAKYHWRYDFHVVSYAATFIFLYAWLLPLALWGALKWTNSSRNTEEELIEVCCFFALVSNIIYCYINPCFTVLRRPRTLGTFVSVWIFLNYLRSSSFPMDNSNWLVAMESSHISDIFIWRSFITIVVTSDRR